MPEERLKAYECERISRCVSRGVVFARNAEEARELAVTMDADESYYEGRGIGKVRRAPECDPDV
jgi:hypothetical protein